MVDPIVYVAFCFLTGLCGSQRRMGILGTTILAILLTPVAVLVVLLLTAPTNRRTSPWWQFRKPHPH
jgi:hypothetical protein